MLDNPGNDIFSYMGTEETLTNENEGLSLIIIQFSITKLELLTKENMDICNLNCIKISTSKFGFNIFML